MEYKKPWNVKVVRRRFETTSTEQLEDGDEDDWKKPISILFIGEEGIDAGGLSREFFFTAFKNYQSIWREHLLCRSSTSGQ